MIEPRVASRSDPGDHLTAGHAEIDLAALSDDKLVEQMRCDLYDGLTAETAEGVGLLLERGWPASRILDDALMVGLSTAGVDYRSGVLFVPEILAASNAMKAGMAALRPSFTETGAMPAGKVVIGTVKGDIHDIGKGLVSMMLEGAGFEVVDLGINADADKFLDALEHHRPDILGMSALLAGTAPYLGVVIEAMKARDIRDEYIVIVGGAPLEEGVSAGADAYCGDAGDVVEMARSLISARRASII
jgi:methanogenic corrinoid protein MtbC1